MSDDTASCPSCGGSGGGPFGRPGSAWDVETYVCARCAGTGRLALTLTAARPIAKSPAEPTSTERPGIAVTRPSADPRKKQTSSG